MKHFPVIAVFLFGAMDLLVVAEQLESSASQADGFCHVPFACTGNQVGTETDKDEDSCEMACDFYTNCNYYTLYVSSGLCLLYQTCELEDETCVDCFSSEPGCDDAGGDCQGSANTCTGNLVGTGDVDTAQECQQACEDVPGCEFYTVYEDGVCLLYATCTLGASCSNCLTYPRECLGDCQVHHQCSPGTVVGSGPEASQESCRQSCINFDDCRYYTFYSSGLCVLFSDCTFDFEECTDCVTEDTQCGDSSGSNYSCVEGIDCESGEVLLTTPNAILDQCDQSCTEDETCTAYTYFRSDQVCLLYATCDLGQVNSCDDCITCTKVVTQRQK